MPMCHTKIMRPVLVLSLCTFAFAQAPPADTSAQDADAVIRANVNVVIAPTTIRDKSGSLVDGLQIRDFQLYDNSKPQTITADIRDEPLSLVVAVQRSSNLTDILPKIQRIGSMLNDTVAGQDSEVAVVSFDHRIQVVQDFTNETTKQDYAFLRIRRNF